MISKSISISKVARASLALSLLVALAGTARGQDHPDEPDPLVAPPPRAAESDRPTKGKSAAASAPAAPSPEAAPAPEIKDGDPVKAEASRGLFAWPWGSGARSPEWTQDWTWAHTHFWMIDVGHVEFDLRWESVVKRRNSDLDQLWKAQARIGLLPHIELGVTENVLWPAHGPVTQEGNEISGRIAFWDYGTVPLNPSVELTWHPHHDGPDEWEARVSAGFELFPRFFVAGDGFFRGETSADHHYTWGFHAAAAFELFPHVLRVGAEGGVAWRFSPDHQEAFRETDPEVGPTVLLRPFGIFKPEWGSFLKITVSALVGLRDDNTAVPYVRLVAIAGCQF